MQVISFGTLTQILVNNLPHPLPLQAMLRFDDQDKLFTYICQHCMVGGRGDYA